MSKDVKHTPSPWRIVEGSESGHCCFKFSIVADQVANEKVEPVVICEVLPELFTCDPKPDFCYANARLIAAAPDLLAALKHCSGWVEAYGRSELRREVRAAITKATGGSDD